MPEQKTLFASTISKLATNDAIVWTGVTGGIQGDARGANATDLQANRNNANQVAVGAYSVCVGGRNRAASPYAISIGFSNNADYGYCLGASNYSGSDKCTSIGWNNDAVLTGCTAVGSDNRAQYNRCTAVGYSNKAYSAYAVSMGYQTYASGNSSVSIGFLCQATASGTAAFGHNVINSTVNSTEVGSSNTNKIRVNSTGLTILAQNLIINTAGKGLNVKEGANARMGASTLVAGTVTVATTAVTATSRILLTHQNNAGTIGFVSVSARTAATSFTILSSNPLDTSSIGWLIMEPA